MSALKSTDKAQAVKNNVVEVIETWPLCFCIHLKSRAILTQMIEIIFTG